MLGLLLAYAAIHDNGATTASLFAIAVATVVVGLLSPGALGLRSVLNHRVRRIADVVLAVVCVVTAIGVTRLDLAATGPLLLVALVLVRLGRSRTPEVRVRRRREQSDPSGPSLARRAGQMVGDVQPLLNRAARAAGVFVRNRRAQRNR